MLYPSCWNNLVTGLIVPSSLLQFVNSLFHTCSNKFGTSSANTSCQQLVKRLVTTCLQVCSNLCVFTCVPLLWQVPKTFHQKFLFPALGDYHVDLDLSVSTCCALKHFLPQFSFKRLLHDTSRGTFRIIIAYQESIIASFEDIWQSKLSQNVDRRLS